MPILEKYDGNNVCNNQDDFNVAFNKAVKYNNKQVMKKNNPLVMVYAVLYLIFFVWALFLAMKSIPGPNRVLHLVFAMCCSPLYVISYYINGLYEGSENTGIMGMRRYY